MGAQFNPWISKIHGFQGVQRPKRVLNPPFLESNKIQIPVHVPLKIILVHFHIFYCRIETFNS